MRRGERNHNNLLTQHLIYLFVVTIIIKCLIELIFLAVLWSLWQWPDSTNSSSHNNNKTTHNNNYKENNYKETAAAILLQGQEL